MLYICIFSNKFDLKQTIRVLHKMLTSKVNDESEFVKVL